MARKRLRNSLPLGRGAGRAAVLMYHRVDEVEHDIWGLAVRPDRFAEHLALLRDRFRPRTLAGLCADLAGRAIEPGTIAVTFDDGYRDNLEVAQPLLAQYEVPATVFVATASLHGLESFWWDDLAEICFARQGLPAVGDVEAGPDERLAWDASPLPGGAASAESREALCRALREQLLPRPPLSIARLLGELRRLAELPAGARTLMNADEIVRLQQGGLVDIGAHTVEHASLPMLTRSAKLDTISTSRLELERLLGESVETFSYPYGDFDAETVACVREAGFACAVTVAEQPVSSATDPLEVPRLYVGNWDGRELAERLARLLEP